MEICALKKVMGLAVHISCASQLLDFASGVWKSLPADYSKAWLIHFEETDNI